MPTVDRVEVEEGRDLGFVLKSRGNSSSWEDVEQGLSKESEEVHIDQGCLNGLQSWTYNLSLLAQKRHEGGKTGAWCAK